MKSVLSLIAVVITAVGISGTTADRLNAASGQVPAPKKYDIKSGTVTYDTTIDMMSMKIPGKVVLYFDDYGMKENEETYKNDKLTESFVSDGKERFKLYHESKMKVAAGKAFNGVAMRFAWNEVSQKDKDAGLAKLGGKETVAGKECETFTIITKTAGEDTSTIYAGWSHVVLSMKLTNKSMKTTKIAVKVDETTPVPAAKFAVPAGYTEK